MLGKKTIFFRITLDVDYFVDQRATRAGTKLVSEKGEIKLACILDEYYAMRNQVKAPVSVLTCPSWDPDFQEMATNYNMGPGSRFSKNIRI